MSAVFHRAQETLLVLTFNISYLDLKVRICIYNVHVQYVVCYKLYRDTGVHYRGNAQGSPPPRGSSLWLRRLPYVRTGSEVYERGC